MAASASARSGPTYEGKPLSYWLSGRKITSDKAQDAVRYAGTNAIPMLLQMVRADDSPLKGRWNAFTLNNGLLWCYFVPAEVRHRQALAGFKTLGLLASNAAPELIKIYDSNVSENPRRLVFVCLSDIGADPKETIPFLLRARTNADDVVRMHAVEALGLTRVRADVIVPALISSLHDPAPDVRVMAVWSLGESGPQASAAVPRLLDLYNSTPADAIASDDDTHVIAPDLIGFALKKIDPAAAARTRWQMPKGQ
jgi:hypothetical protein